MRRAWLIVALVGAAAGCPKSRDPLPEGAACRDFYDCASYHCIAYRCTSGGEGAACANEFGDCNAGLKCVEAQCAGPARAKELAARAAAAKEREMLEQSGVQARPNAPAAEKPVAAAGPGPRIRVVTTKAKGSAFAVCRPDERLTGGSCTGWNLQQNGPTDFGSDDTVGARWSCKAAGPEIKVTAVAMCAKLP